MCRTSWPPCLIITTCLGVCRTRSALAGKNMLGMPLGRQDERAWNAIFPRSISSLSFFITSLAHGFRLGLERSPIRHVAPWLMKGCPGSWTTGEGEPGTGGNVEPPPWIHPPSPAEKTGGAGDLALAPPIKASEAKRTAAGV